MNIPFLTYLNRLGPVGYIIFGVIGLLMVYLTFTNRIHIMFSLMVLSAAFVGSTISMLDSLSALSRWVTIFLLLFLGVTKSRMKVSLGMLFFWLYVLLGFISLFNANLFSWQFQKSVLLIIVTMGISLAFGDKPFETFKSTLTLIAISATIFSLVNFFLLPGQLSDPTRFSGLAKGAASFAATLGGMLPFAFYGFLQERRFLLKLVYGAGFLVGAITLVFTGQRAGTIAGVLGVIPLLGMIWKKKNFAWFMILAIGVIIAGVVFLQQTSFARQSFLVSRYSLDYGLSGRDLIWQRAISEIGKDPIVGHGIGAAEQVISASFHNAYLEVWFNAGILGLLFFVAAQVYFFLRFLSFLGKVKNPEQVEVLALAFGYFMGFLVLCIFESIGAGASNINLMLYIFLGVLVSKQELFKNNDKPLSSAS
jgi:O-antigen ligase